jgi:hypothetical protein
MRAQQLSVLTAVVLLVGVSLAGCTAGAKPSAAHPASRTSSGVVPTKTRAESRIGSAGNPLVKSCAKESLAYPPISQHPQPGDLVVGPLFIIEGNRLARAKPAGYGQHGAYKIPVVLTEGSTATITVSAPARKRVVIDPQSAVGSAGGVSAITYHACQHQLGFFPQILAFTDGQIRGCVPLDVKTDHPPRVRHINLSLFTTTCAT